MTTGIQGNALPTRLGVVRNLEDELAINSPELDVVPCLNEGTLGP